MTDYNDGKIHGWNGGECPVHPKTGVRVWMSCGDRSYNTAGTYEWGWITIGGDIIAFQVVEAYSDPVPPRESWSFDYHTFNTEADALRLRKKMAKHNPGKGYEDMPITRWREVKE
jgi:hypothetical protein